MLRIFNGTRQVTLQLLTQYLERYGWSEYRTVDEPFEKEGLIYADWRASGETESLQVVIDPMVEKNCLAFRVPYILKVQRKTTSADRLAELLTAVGFINYRMILGKFAYDPRDGELRFSLDIPIDGGTLTYKQFAHCLRVTTKMVEEYLPKLRDILRGKLAAQQLIEEESSSSLAPLLGMLELIGDGLRHRVGRVEEEDESEQEDEPLSEV